ncbi:MAG: cupin domain-containing protein [Patescibacteria group bacterium]|jgi:mannose-6-phosphate isomerase-like protein (cupin superfamily)
MTGFVGNIEEESLNNDNFRKVLFTAPHSQLVVMSVVDEIGMEVHPENDQFIRIEKGTGKAILNGEESELKDGSAVVVPAGTNHNFINTGSEPLKLYTIYSPAHHPDGTIHKTKADAMAAEKAE